MQSAAFLKLQVAADLMNKPFSQLERLIGKRGQKARHVGIAESETEDFLIFWARFSIQERLSQCPPVPLG